MKILNLLLITFFHEQRWFNLNERVPSCFIKQKKRENNILHKVEEITSQAISIKIDTS